MHPGKRLGPSRARLRAPTVANESAVVAGERRDAPGHHRGYHRRLPPLHRHSHTRPRPSARLHPATRPRCVPGSTRSNAPRRPIKTRTHTSYSSVTVPKSSVASTMGLEDMRHAGRQTLRERDMQKFVGPMCIRSWAKYSGHHKLGLRKLRAQHSHNR